MTNSAAIDVAMSKIHTEMPKVSFEKLKEKILPHLQELYHEANLDGKMSAVKEFCYPK